MSTGQVLFGLNPLQAVFLDVTIPLVPIENALTCNCHFSEVPLQSDCVDLVRIAGSLH